ncbi:unnamed protein product [marine sediment metagenome]|uniref:Phage protein n=1 Tax=marine sediment metagenome TaxID=412755 RepID=X0V026_9ZZZZ
MDTNDKDFEQMLMALKAYIDQLNITLTANIPKELNKTKQQCEEIVDLAGELDAYFRK